MAAGCFAVRVAVGAAVAEEVLDIEQAGRRARPAELGPPYDLATAHRQQPLARRESFAGSGGRDREPVDRQFQAAGRLGRVREARDHSLGLREAVQLPAGRDRDRATSYRMNGEVAGSPSMNTGIQIAASR